MQGKLPGRPAAAVILNKTRTVTAEVRDRGNPSGTLYKAPSVIRMKLPVYILR